MNHHWHQKLTAFTLVCAMILTLFPASVFAWDAQDEAPAEPAVCICAAACTEDAANADCPVCAADRAGCAIEAEPTVEPTVEPTEQLPAEPAPAVCICAALCAADAVDGDCPVCAEDWEKCTFASHPLGDETCASILAQVMSIAGRYDALAAEPGAVDADGNLLDDAQREQFLSNWSALLDEMDALAEANPEVDVYNTLSADETFVRLHTLFNAMSGYAPETYIDTPASISNGWNGYYTWIIMGYSSAISITGSNELTILSCTNGAGTQSYYIMTSEQKGTTEGAKSAVGGSNFSPTAGSGGILYVSSGRGDSNGAAPGSIEMTGGLVDTLYCGGHGRSVAGNGSIKMSGGTVRVIAAGIYDNGGAALEITGGTVKETVSGGTGSGTFTLAISGNTKIGSAGDAEKGIMLSTLTSKKFTISNPLDTTSRINIIPVAGAKQGDILATATNESYFTAKNFTLAGNKPCYKDGIYLKYGNAVTVSEPAIYANGFALVIEASGSGTTVYIDSNGNGVVDTGEQSLKTAGVSNAPSDGADLSAWTIYGGANRADVSSTKIAMHGGKVDSMYGAGVLGGVNGDVNITMDGGTVTGTIVGAYNGSNSKVSGAVKITVEGSAKCERIIGGGNDKTTTIGSSEIRVQGNAQITGVDGVIGGSYGSGPVTGNTSVTVAGTAIINGNVWGGSATTTEGNAPIAGNTAVYINGGTVKGNVYGGANVGSIGGTTAVNISNGTVMGDVCGGSKSSTATIAGKKITVTISGGKINGSVTGTTATAGTSSDVVMRLSGSPQIGVPGDNQKGILVKTFSYRNANPPIYEIYVDSALGANAAINIAGADNNALVAISKGTVAMDAAKFTIGGWRTPKVAYLTASNEYMLQVGAVQPAPTVSGTNIYGNGSMLLVAGESSGTTVYWDRNRNGVKDAADISLRDAGVANAPANGADLTTYSVYGGWEKNNNTGDTSVTMIGGSVGALLGGSNATGTTQTGNAVVTVHGGTIKYLYGGGNNAMTSGNVVITMDGGQVLYGVSAAGRPANVGGTRTINLSGNIQIGTPGHTSEGLNLPYLYAYNNGNLNIGTLNSASRINLLTSTATTDLTYTVAQGTVVAKATQGATLNTSNFTATNYQTLSLGTGNTTLVLGPKVPEPTVDGTNIFGNGAALLITEGTAAGTTTVYWDKARNGVLDAGIDTPVSAAVSNANLSTYSVGGGSLGAAVTGDTLITMTGGAVSSLKGGGMATTTGANVTGNAAITVTGGTVSTIWGGGTCNANSNSGTSANVSGSITIKLGGSAVITSAVNGGGYAYAPGKTVTANVGAVTITLDGSVSGSGLEIYGGGYGANAGAGAVTINLGGNAQVGRGVYGAGRADAKITSAAVNVSGNPTVGNKTSMGVDLSMLASKKVVVTGALTGTDGGITLIGLVNPQDDTVVAAGSGAKAEAFTLSGKMLALSGSNVVVTTGVSAPKLYSAGYASSDALIFETTARSFYKKLSSNLYGSAYGGYFKLSNNWAPILLSNREEAIQWLGVNADGSTVNNPQLNVGAHKKEYGGQTYYYSTTENQIASGSTVTGPANKAFFGVLASMEAAADYILEKAPQSAVTYDLNGGTGDALPTGHKKLNGLTFAIPKLTLAKGGVAISGWNTRADGQGTAYDLNGTITADGDITLYAQYDATKVTVTLDPNGGSASVLSVQAASGKLMPSMGAVPVKENNTFAGYFDDKGVQYYLDDGTPARNYPTANGPTKLTAKWVTGVGVLAGRYSQYQVFDCHRTPAYPVANQPFRVFQFANPFTDATSNHQMSNAEINGKIFYFKFSNNENHPFELWMANDAAGTNEVRVSKPGKIYALGKEGFLFISTAGANYGYFISLSQALKPGGEITYLPDNPGPISKEDAESTEVSPTPWDPDGSYTVTFNSNGATVAAAPSSISARKPLESTLSATLGLLPTDPVKTGYSFDGWYTTATGGTKFSADTTVLTGNITVYAHWNRAVTTSTSISLRKDGNAWSGQTVAIQVVNSKNEPTGTVTTAVWNSSTKVYATSAITNPGTYAILLGGRDTGARFTHETNKADNIDLNYYSVTYNAGGGSGSVPAGSSFRESSVVQVLFTPVPTKASTVFAGWTDRAPGMTPGTGDTYHTYAQGRVESFVLAGSTTLVACFRLATPTVGDASKDFTATQPTTGAGKGGIQLNQPDKKGDFQYSTDGGVTWKPWPDGGLKDLAQGSEVQIKRLGDGYDLDSDVLIITIQTVLLLDNLVTANNYTGTYDGAAHSATITLTGEAHDAVVTYYTDAGYTQDGTTTPPTRKDAGETTVYFTVAKAGYETLKSSAKITVSKAPLTVTYPGQKVTYTAGGPTLSELVYSGFVNGETVDVLTTKPTVTNANNLPGIYTLTPSGGQATNYAFQYVGGILAINAASMVGDVEAKGWSGAYDGQNHSITVTALDDTTVTYYSDAAMGTALGANPAYKDADSYTVYFKVSKAGYDPVTGSAQVIINKKVLTPTVITVNDKPYDGNTATNGTLKLDDVVSGETVTVSGTITFTDKNAGTNKTVNVSNMALSGDGAKNYMLSNTALTDVNTTAEITAKEVTLVWANAGDRTYDGQPSDVRATVTGLLPGDVCAVTVTGGNEKDAGSYTATATLENRNYTVSGTKEQVYTVTPAILTIQYDGASVIYKDTFPDAAKNITVKGFVNGETPMSLGGNYTAPNSLTGKKGDLEFDVLSSDFSTVTLDAGTYSLIPGGAVAKNYTIDAKAGNLVILSRDFNSVVIQDYTGEYDGKSHTPEVLSTDAAAPSNLKVTYYGDETCTNEIETPNCKDVVDSMTFRFKVTADNFTTQTGSATITIHPKKVTPNINGTDTKVYDGTTDVPGGITLKLNGVLTGEDAGLSTGTLAMADANVGTGKSVTATGIAITNTNYELTASTASAAGIATVTPKEVTLTWSGHEKRTYNGTPSAVTATTVDTACGLAVTGGDAVNAGTHTATATISNSNYELKTGASQTYVIEKATLTATFVNETIVYGNPPKLEIKVEGFVNGESATSAAGYAAPTLVPTPTPTDASAYTMTPVGGSADNYIFDYVNGTLTIGKAPAADGKVIAAGYDGVYDGQAHGITVTALGDATVVYAKAADYSGATSTEIKYTDATDGPQTVYYKVSWKNYADVTGQQTINITKKSVTPSIDSVNGKEYNADGAATGALTLTGVLAGETVTASGTFAFPTPAAGKNKLVNVSGITLGGEKAGNYTLTTVTLTNQGTTAEITPKEVTLSWSGYTDLVYDAAAKNVTAAAGGMVGGDACTVTVTGGTEMYPGSYTATAAALSNHNYKLPVAVTQGYTIEKAEITGVVVTPYEGVVDGFTHPAITKVEGTLDGDKIRYSTDKVNWSENGPMVDVEKDTEIYIEVLRPYHKTLELTVTAKVMSAPIVKVAKPIFDPDNVKMVTVGGTVEKGGYAVEKQLFELRKTGTDVWTMLEDGTTVGDKTTYSQALADLVGGTEYELRLTATDTLGNQGQATLKFRTQPEKAVTGEVEGSVEGGTSGSITVTIEMGNTVVGTIQGLSDGETFTFQNLPDGEYNLVATDTHTGYQVTKMATVKDGKTTQIGVMKVGNTQSQVKVENKAPDVAADGLEELFATGTYNTNTAAQEAVDDGGTVEIRLIADEVQKEEQLDAIKEKMNGDTLGVQLDLQLKMIIMPKDANNVIQDLEEVEEFLTVAVPLPADAVGKNGYRAFRYHGDEVQELKLLAEGESPVEGSFRVVGGYVYIYTAKFSTYALSYTVPSSSGSGSGIGAGYALKYETNGGGAIPSGRYSLGTVVQLNQVPTREGYTFMGWYADSALTRPVTEIKMTKDLTVYAKWERTAVPALLDGVTHGAYVVGYEDGAVRPGANITRAEVAQIFYRLLKAEVRDANRTGGNSFPDCGAGRWYQEAVSTLVALGILHGDERGNFNPDANITRAEFAAVAARFSQRTYTGPDLFTDIGGHWAREEINRAASNGWIMGEGDGTFRPDDAITRAEVMTLINRLLQRNPAGTNALLPGMKTWRDNADPAAWYYLSVQEATNAHDYERDSAGAETWTELLNEKNS